MNQFNGFKPERPAVAVGKLPAGIYSAKILSVKEKEYSWGSVLVFAFDIDEGEHKGHFDEEFKNNPNEDKKWKGTYRLTVPVEGSTYFANNLKTFNNTIWAIEDSNKGYHWDWDETKLKGKKVCVVFRNKEWEYNGSTGWTTECAFFASVEDMKAGKVRVAKDKPLANKPAPSIATESGEKLEVIVDDSELPF